MCRGALCQCANLVILLALVTADLASAGELALAKDGAPRSVIVLAEQPSPAAKKAAAVLQSHLHAATGAELEIIAETKLAVDAEKRQVVGDPAREAYVFLLVGESRIAKALGLDCQGLGPGGIAVETLPNAIAILGQDAAPADPQGTLYAVTWFLEQLGCRSLWPGETGKVIPRQTSAILGEIHHRYSPPILQRRIRSLGYGERVQQGLDRLGFTRDDYLRLREQAMSVSVADPGWFQWHRLGGTMDLRSGHAFGNYWVRFGKQHPEWFAMQPNGSRDQSLAGDRARLCKSNLALIDQIAGDKIAELSANPGRTSVSVAPNDGGRLTFCMCERCKQLDPPGGRPVRLLYDDASGGRIERKYFDYVSLTDRMCWFYNRIAERVAKVHPQALLVADAYSVYAAPPVREKLGKNIVIRFVPMTYLSDEGRGQALSDWDAWSRAAAKIYFRPNFLGSGRREGSLLLFAHKMAEDLRYLSANGLVGTDFDSCLHNWSTHGLNYYLLARLLWDPRQDAGALIDDYCRSGFGPAASPVREYFARVEQATDSIAASSGGSPRDVDVTASYTPQRIAELRGLLDQAGNMASNNPAIEARLRFLRHGLDFTDLQAQAYRLLRADGKPDRLVARQVLDKDYWLMREIFENDPLAVNVAYVAWGGGGLWKRLGWSWEGEHQAGTDP